MWDHCDKTSCKGPRSETGESLGRYCVLYSSCWNVPEWSNTDHGAQIKAVVLLNYLNVSMWTYGAVTRCCELYRSILYCELRADCITLKRFPSRWCSFIPSFSFSTLFIYLKKKTNINIFHMFIFYFLYPTHWVLSWKMIAFIKCLIILKYNKKKNQLTPETVLVE